MSNLTKIPIAVVNYLNSLTLSMNFVAKKRNYPSLELKDFIDLQVHVLTGKKTTELDTRASKLTYIDVFIIVKKVINKDTEDIDSLIDFVDEINTALLGVVITETGVRAACIKSVYEAAPDMNQLNIQNTFAGALTLTYHDLLRA